MTTKVIVCANHGETGETHVRIVFRGADGQYVHHEDDPVQILKGPMIWAEVWVPDDGQVVISEKR